MRIAAFLVIGLLFLTGVTTTHVADRAGAEPCDPNYAGACVAVSTSDLDCEDVGGPVRVVGTDTHRLDVDKDGVGCEANGDDGGGASSTRQSSRRSSASSSDSRANCRSIFRAGKGMVDSCSSEHPETSRVYPRKPGMPANGCVNNCPAQSDATPAPERQQAPSTPAPAPRTPPPPIEATPGDSVNPPPADTGATPVPSQNCDRVSYPDICVPPAPPYLSCSDIPERNFRVRAPDPHRFDADNNGIGCEEVRGPIIGR